MPKISREHMLHVLESVAPGLAARETIEQSSCFVFRNGSVCTFNEEIACTHDLDLGVEGAVAARPLLEILGKLTEDEVDIQVHKTDLVVGGRGRESGIRMESEIALPIESVYSELPSQWLPLPEGFGEALDICQQCTSRDDSGCFYLTCVNIHPKWVEASDDFQISRFKIKTDIPEASLIRRDSAKYVAAMGARELAQTATWLHFRNNDGLVVSCRRYVENYPSDGVTRALKFEGSPVSLPKGLREAADRAQVFSKENANANLVLVELRPGKVRIQGAGISGWYRERSKLQYQGEPMAFLIAPAVLMEVVKEHNELLIAPDRLKVDAGRWQYVSCLSRPDDEGQGEGGEFAATAADTGPAEMPRSRKETAQAEETAAKAKSKAKAKRRQSVAPDGEALEE